MGLPVDVVPLCSPQPLHVLQHVALARPPGGQQHATQCHCVSRTGNRRRAVVGCRAHTPPQQHQATRGSVVAFMDERHPGRIPPGVGDRLFPACARAVCGRLQCTGMVCGGGGDGAGREHEVRAVCVYHRGRLSEVELFLCQKCILYVFIYAPIRKI